MFKTLSPGLSGPDLAPAPDEALTAAPGPKPPEAAPLGRGPGIFGEGNPCAYCARGMTKRGPRQLYPTRDHVIPVSRGGTKTVWACERCNAIKGNMMPDEWAAFMAANPGWWTMGRADIRAAKNQRRELKRGSYRYTGLSVPVPPRLIYSTGGDQPKPPMAETLAAWVRDDDDPTATPFIPGVSG